MTDLKYDTNGLIPVVVQDRRTNEVLMVAWANAETVGLMESTGYTHFWSRSRQKLWKKGEESGNVQRIVSIQTDCDADTLLVRVDQTGVACHLGKPSCFDEVLYGTTDSTMAVIPELARVIKDRKENPSDESYTCKLMNNETQMCKKVVEEAAEFVLSVKDGDADSASKELADLIYHVMVLAEAKELPVEKTYEELSERRQ
ncbi:MAG: bifunctional phosphoribosyl-AMP cyclohydrolase/phosphoribosyl-ATP diphosphatase HisIE [Candidatus Methanomethylophilaceae archaeon]|nr:phosphoribosyl-AMP cyclohydrolase / phosphoribosyl-ATP pyrophosphohydrolase [Candidatus Methanomethylophilaceae archaeon]